MKIQANQMNIDQIKELDRLYTACAGVIYQKVDKLEIKEEYSFIFNESIADDMVKCFENSKLYYKNHLDIYTNFELVLETIFPNLQEDIQRILYPVLFYTLIMKNEVNHRTIDSRARRETRCWGNTDDLVNIPIARWHRTEGNKTKFNKLCACLKPEYERYLLNAHILQKSIGHESLEMQAYWALDFADHITEIMDIQYDAKVGLFVLDLLKETHSAERPVDTLLRMYLIERISGLITSTEAISNGYWCEKSSDQGLLCSYYVHGGPLVERQLSEYGRGDIRERHKYVKVNIKKKTNVLEPKPRTGKVWFDLLYQDITQSASLSNQEVLDIVDYFFNRKKLEWYANYYQEVIDYLTAIISALKAKNHFYSDRFRNCTRYWLFEKDRPKESSDQPDKTGKSKKYTNSEVVCRLKVSAWESIDKIATETKMSRAKVIAELIDFALDKYNCPKE